jgi:hypothetical protein
MKRRDVLLAGLAAGALFPALAAAAIPCGELAAGFQAPDVVISSATEVAAVPSGNNAAPAHCDVRGTIRGNIKFAVFLPVEWNGRFMEDSHGVAKGRKRVKGEQWIGEKETDKFLKLYLVPGMAHCGGGTGHANVDWLSPLVNWVENGVAPHAIVGSRTQSGVTTTRPHCPYPQEAVLTGGNDADAASYTCMALD